MTREGSKLAANEIFEIFVKHEKGECSYDRALEDAGRKLMDLFAKEPIVGYTKSGALQRVLLEISRSRKVNVHQTYLFDVQVHQNEMRDVDSMLKSFNQ